MRKFSFLKNKDPFKHPWPSAVALGFLTALGIGVLQSEFDFIHPLWDALFCAAWGFIFGALYQELYREKQKDIDKEVIEKMKSQSSSRE